MCLTMEKRKTKWPTFTHFDYFFVAVTVVAIVVVVFVQSIHMNSTRARAPSPAYTQSTDIHAIKSKNYLVFSSQFGFISNPSPMHSFAHIQHTHCRHTGQALMIWFDSIERNT